MYFDYSPSLQLRSICQRGVLPEKEQQEERKEAELLRTVERAKEAKQRRDKMNAKLKDAADEAAARSAEMKIAQKTAMDARLQREQAYESIARSQSMMSRWSKKSKSEKLTNSVLRKIGNAGQCKGHSIVPNDIKIREIVTVKSPEVDCDDRNGITVTSLLGNVLFGDAEELEELCGDGFAACDDEFDNSTRSSMSEASGEPQMDSATYARSGSGAPSRLMRKNSLFTIDSDSDSEGSDYSCASGEVYYDCSSMMSKPIILDMPTAVEILKPTHRRRSSAYY